MGKDITPPRAGPAFTDLDLDGAGRQLGFVSIPHSPDDDAWGVIRVPIAIVGGGDGPTVVLEGGNHGDEYEGPIVIAELIRELDPGSVKGRLILMPANNAPALAAGRRTSPLDGLNFNRVFPGDPLGTITRQIAAFVNDEVFPRADAFIDLHSGGSSLRVLPSAIVEPSDDPALRRRNIEAALAFGAPTTVVIDNLGDPRTATAAACRAGLVTMGTELAGGGGVSPEALGIARRGVRNVLIHLGLLEGQPAGEPERAAGQETALLELPGPKAHVFAASEGVFEPFHELGRPVAAGEPAGQVHAPLDPSLTPDVLYYQASGIVFGLRRPGKVRPGNCCAVVAAPKDLSD